MKQVPVTIYFRKQVCGTLSVDVSIAEMLSTGEYVLAPAVRGDELVEASLIHVSQVDRKCSL